MSPDQQLLAFCQNTHGNRWQNSRSFGDSGMERTMLGQSGFPVKTVLESCSPLANAAEKRESSIGCIAHLFPVQSSSRIVAHVDTTDSLSLSRCNLASSGRLPAAVSLADARRWSRNSPSLNSDYFAPVVDTALLLPKLSVISESIPLSISPQRQIKMVSQTPIFMARVSSCSHFAVYCPALVVQSQGN